MTSNNQKIELNEFGVVMEAAPTLPQQYPTQKLTKSILKASTTIDNANHQNSRHNATADDDMSCSDADDDESINISDDDDDGFAMDSDSSSNMYDDHPDNDLDQSNTIRSRRTGGRNHRKFSKEKSVFSMINARRISSNTNRAGRAVLYSGNVLLNSTTSVFGALKSETVRVIYSKRLVYLIIFCVAAGFGTLTYFHLYNAESTEFTGQYNKLCDQLIGLSDHEISQIFDSFRIMSTEVTALAIDDEIIWPYFTSPYFAQSSAVNRIISKTSFQAIAPFVTIDGRSQWEPFSAFTSSEWIKDSIAVEEHHIISSYPDTNWIAGRRQLEKHDDGEEDVHDGKISPDIQRFEFYDHGRLVNQTDTPPPQFGGPGSYAPIWQHAPYTPEFINYDLLSYPAFNSSYENLWEKMDQVLSETFFPLSIFNGTTTAKPSMYDKELRFEDPYTAIIQPIYSKFYQQDENPKQKDLVGLLIGFMPWKIYFQDLFLKDALNGLILVLKDTTDRTYSFRVDGSETTYLGEGDFHDPKYDSLLRDHVFLVNHDHSEEENHEENEYMMYMYPSTEMEENFRTNEPVVYTCIVVGMFIFTTLLFALYNYFVQSRQNKIMAALNVTSKVIASLFPANVLDRLLKEVEDEVQKETNDTQNNGRLGKLTQKAKLRDFLDDTGHKDPEEIVFKTRPIADLYLNATVMYADIVGFTAWSSVREPCQVFTLLENIFKQFDIIAKRRRIFKVETIGDCYVAVCGVPHPRADHAVAMARFSRDCVHSMNVLVKKLEIVLGPDTADLAIRIGLHSGPVTAGILRGEKSRFQLFGSTVNFCAKIESAGARDKIHISQQTADLLTIAGKSAWLEKRQDVMDGDTETYWLSFKSRAGSKASGSDAGSSEGNSSRNRLLEDEEEMEVPLPLGGGGDYNHFNAPSLGVCKVFDSKVQRLIEWNSEMLIRLLKQVAAHRKTLEQTSSNTKEKGARETFFRRPSKGSIEISEEFLIDFARSDDDEPEKKTIINEVVEIIDMPALNATRANMEPVDPGTIMLQNEVCQEIKNFVSVIASLYRENPFHNFEHASHVTMSVSKLLSRIIAPDRVLNDDDENETNLESCLHDHTYGITSDPMTQFACVFSALIHDVDHRGVPNATLVKEEADVAKKYNNQSVAEQNSVDIAWRLFMEDSHENFRQLLCPTSADMNHFRQLVVNSVMATDIVDKELKELRNKRWDVAFHAPETLESVPAQVNRKATIVIEHLIQASDISHTMQHWHVYTKWNEKFFHEMYRAYREGHSEVDPSTFWYKGEIGFYDFYIIPLAKKLKECGVFGVSSDEYLNYAMKNREEWEHRGEEVVAGFIEKYRTMFDELEADKYQ